MAVLVRDKKPDGLISRETLIENLLNARHYETDTMLKLIRFIEKQPTVESKTGQWEERERFTNDECPIDEWQIERCNECGRYLTTPYRYYFFHHNYCPYCGIRMEGENEA